MMQPKALSRPLSDPFTLASAHFISRSCSRHPSRSAILGSPCSSNRGSNCKMYKKPSHSAHRPKAAQLTEEHRKDVLAAFNHFDSDGSGSIDMSELGVAMKSLGFEPRKDDLKAMLGSMDDDENGTINFEEFLSMMTIKISESAARKECDKAFRSLTAKLQLLDPNEAGFLTLESFSDVVASSGEQFSDEEIKLMFQDADIDGDGKLSFTDFMEYMKVTGILS